MSNTPRVIFAGNCRIGLDVLKYINDDRAEIIALVLPAANMRSYDEKMVEICNKPPTSRIFKNKTYKKTEQEILNAGLSADYIISVHYPHIFSQKVLDLPSHDAINVHPGYLPHNRGWHTATWAILNQTKFGVTIHKMERSVDSGDIIARKEMKIKPDDTARSLENRAEQIEMELFKKTWPSLANFDYESKNQSEKQSRKHNKSDIKSEKKLTLDENVSTRQLITKLRALTTTIPDDSAYFIKDGVKYRVQIDIFPDKSE
jgi:methionyl-tRNA formyltransferase